MRAFTRGPARPLPHRGASCEPRPVRMPRLASRISSPSLSLRADQNHSSSGTRSPGFSHSGTGSPHGLRRMKPGAGGVVHTGPPSDLSGAEPVRIEAAASGSPPGGGVDSRCGLWQIPRTPRPSAAQGLSRRFLFALSCLRSEDEALGGGVRRPTTPVLQPAVPAARSLLGIRGWWRPGLSVLRAVALFEHGLRAGALRRARAPLGPAVAVFAVAAVATSGPGRPGLPRSASASRGAGLAEKKIVRGRTAAGPFLLADAVAARREPGGGVPARPWRGSWQGGGSSPLLRAILRPLAAPPRAGGPCSCAWLLLSPEGGFSRPYPLAFSFVQGGWVVLAFLWVALGGRARRLLGWGERSYLLASLGLPCSCIAEMGSNVDRYGVFSCL